MLPHLRERPLTMKRFPDGVEGKSFFEKHIPSHAPDWVRSVDVPSNDGTGRHPLRHGQRPPDVGLGGQSRDHRAPRAAVARRAAPQAARSPRPHGVRPRPRRGHVHRRVLRRGGLRDGRAREGRAGVASPRRAGRRVCSSTRRSGRRRPGTACATARHDIARKLEIGAPGPRRLQHAQVAAPGPRPDRLEPEPPGQDDRRRVLGPGHADADGVDTRDPAEVHRCATDEGPASSSASRPTTCCAGSRQDGDLFAPLGVP